jgi:hypothetical protein
MFILFLNIWTYCSSNGLKDTEASPVATNIGRIFDL